MCKLHILIIENDVKVIDYLKQMINKLIENAEVSFTDNEEKALELLKNKPISLVMLNCQQNILKEICKEQGVQTIPYDPNIDFDIDIQ